jgi:hypothetical protein
MQRFIPNRTPCGRTRREYLWEVGGGFAGLALADLLMAEERATSPLAERRPHFLGEGEALCVSVHEWRAVAGGHI